MLVQNLCLVWLVTRSWQGYMISRKTPVENLYNVGDGVNPSGWTVCAAVAEIARIAAEDSAGI